MSNRTFYITSVVFFVLAFCFLYSISYDNRAVGLLSDDALYLIMADFYSPWVETLDYVQAFVSVTIHFPPLYSLFLGILGAGSENPEYAFLLNTLCLSVALFIVVIWLKKETENVALAYTVATLTLVLPTLLLLSQELWSEFLFMVFFYLFLYVFSHKEMQKEHFFLCALLAGLMTLTRSIGLSVVIAYSMYLLYKRPRYFWVYLVVAISPFIYLKFKSSSNPFRENYVDAFNARVPDLFNTNIFDYASEQLVSLWQSWVYLFSPIQWSFLPVQAETVVLTVLLLAFFIGFFLRLLEHRIDALIVIIYLAIVAVWPYSEVRFVSRFLSPLLPLIFFYSILGNQFVFSRLKLARHCYVIPVLVVLVIISSDLHILKRAYASMEPELKPYSRIKEWLTHVSYENAISEVKTRKRYLEILKQLQDYIPEDDCTYAIHPPVTMLHTKRMSGSYLDAASSVDELLERLPTCNYMIASYLVDHTEDYDAYYPMDLVWDSDRFEFYAFYLDEEAGSEQKSQILLMLIKRIDNESLIDKNRQTGSKK